MLDRSIIPVMVLSLCATADTENTARQTSPAEPMLVAAGYAGPGAKPPRTAIPDVETLRRDLARIRQSGYTAVSTWIPWDEAEPQKGVLRIDGPSRLVAEAAARDLSVVVQVLISRPPAWAKGDPAAAHRFVDAIRARVSAVRGVVRVEPEGPAEGTRIDLLPGPSGFARSRLAFWTAVARGEKLVTLMDPAGGVGQDLLAFAETAGVVTRNEALFAPLRPRPHGVRQVSAGGGASVEVRLLESRDVIMIIGLNRAAAPRTVRITFEPDIPEAIWQNLETGATVNFVMTKEGPVLETPLGAHDALVLMTGRKLR